MTKVDRVGPMFKGKTPPVGEDKHLFHKRGLKGRVVVLIFVKSDWLLGSLTTWGYNPSEKEDRNEINFNNRLLKWYWP